MGKKIRKAVGALFVAAAIAATQIPVSDVEAVDASTANTPSVSDFQMSETTLIKYNGTSENVFIGDYVEKIESGAFADNDAVKTISLGKNVKSIGSGAFEGCSNLQSVTIPDSVEEIEKAAFAGCPSLSTVNIGTGLHTLGNGAFAGDTSLEKVSISSSNPKFTCDDGAIYNKDGRDTLYALLSGRKGTEYAMISSVSKIKPYAFWGDRYLESVSINGNVSEISAYAFSNCANLKQVKIPFSVKTIGLKAFENCIRLRDITIPVSVTTIHSTAFDGCTKLKIHAEDGSTAKSFADSLVLEDIEVTEYEDTPIDTISDEGMDSEPEDVPEEPLNVDYYHEVTHMNPLESEDDGNSVKGKSKIIGRQAFVFIDNASATVNSGLPDFSQSGGVAYGETGETIASISTGSDEKGGSFPKYTIVDGKIIANQAYYNDSRASITIPDGITEIGEFAFARSGLTDIVIPDGVTKIGYAAFYHCDSLTDVVIPSTVTEIAPAAFDNTPWYQNWMQGANGDFLIAGDGILLGYRGSNSIVTIPEGIKTVGAGAFEKHTEITSIVLPDSVEVIGEGAFSGCSSLAGIEGGNAVRFVKDRAFLGCPLTEIKIPASVEEIGLKAFAVADSVRVGNIATVIFEGSSIPKLSYEASSGKLYNDSYRGLVFEGISNAVVPEGTVSLEGTVLDGELPGFRGVIRFNETDVLSDTSLEGTEESQNMEPDGNQARSQAGVIVHINSRSIDEFGLSNAIMDGAEKSYILDIVESNDAKASIQDSYRKLYGNSVPANLQGYEITLQEADTAIPITGLGKQKIEITIPLPNGIGEENLHVVSLDANGQLEDKESRIASVDGMDCIVFTTNHFSPFGIYNYISGSTAAVNDGQAVFTSLSGNKDDSPNTGDGSIHPKWFLCMGFLFTGMALLFYRGKKWSI